MVLFDSGFDDFEADAAFMQEGWMVDDGAPGEAQRRADPTAEAGRGWPRKDNERSWPGAAGSGLQKRGGSSARLGRSFTPLVSIQGYP